MDNDSSHHMIGMMLVFLIILEIGSHCHVGYGDNTMHAMKGVGCVRFQLESGWSLEVAKMFVPAKSKPTPNVNSRGRGL